MLASMAAVTKVDVYVIAIAGLLTLATISILRQVVIPSFSTLSSFMALLNSKGGLIFVLLILWIISFTASIALGLWALVKGVSPENAILMMLLSWVTGQAWGNINGALLKTMTGEQPPLTPPIIAPKPSTPETPETSEKKEA